MTTEDLIKLLADPNAAAAMLKDLQKALTDGEEQRTRIAAEREEVSQQRAASRSELEKSTTTLLEAVALKKSADSILDKQSLRAAELDNRVALAEARAKDLSALDSSLSQREMVVAERERDIGNRANEVDRLAKLLDTKFIALRSIIAE